VTTKSFVATGLTTGSRYKFRVESRNINGYSSLSTVVSIYAATVPSKPDAPTTNVSGNNVVFSWAASYSGGTAITSFKIEIRQHNGQYSQDLVNCNGANL